MKKILVLGGTRFFGKKLVELLIKHEYEVSIATRGLTANSFQGIKRLIADRNDTESLAKLALSGPWDFIYDQICYSPGAAAIACQAFAGKVGSYIFTSSQVVYDSSDQALREEDFNPYNYEINRMDSGPIDYTEGKKLAEAVFFQKAAFPVVAVRFPMVLGLDDHTKRMDFHIEHVKSEQPIGIVNPHALLSFIRATEAAEFLLWLANSKITGPLNACSNGYTTLYNILTIIERITGKKARILPETRSEDQSPYFLKPGSWYMDNSRAQNLGFRFSNLDDWLTDLIYKTNCRE